MTEEEMTQLAILKTKAMKAQAEDEELQAQGKPQVNTQETITDVNAPKSEDTKEIVYKYPISLGKDKEINFNPWTGKTKKQIKKIMVEATENEDVPDFKKILDVIIFDHIDKKDIFLSETEQQYTVMKIREKSISDEMAYIATCPKCDEESSITEKISECIHYTPSTFPGVNLNIGDGIHYTDINSREHFDEIVKGYIDSPDYDGITTSADIEIAMKIQRDGVVTSPSTPIDNLDWIDTLPLMDLNTVLKDIDNLSAKIKVSSEAICEYCETKVTFETREIPNIFSDIIE